MNYIEPPTEPDYVSQGHPTRQQLSPEDQALVDEVVRENELALVDARQRFGDELDADADYVYGSAAKQFFLLFDLFFCHD